MSNHSSAFPSEVATISLVTFFFLSPVRRISGASACPASAISNPFHRPLEWTRHFAEIPEQAGHDAECFLGEAKENVLVGRMLRTAGIGVRYPDRRERQRVGEHIVGQRAAEIRQHRRRLSGGLPARLRGPFDAGTVEIGARSHK